jgi:Spy/CpxP family protein refolding chaperone
MLVRLFLTVILAAGLASAQGGRGGGGGGGGEEGMSGGGGMGGGMPQMRRQSRQDMLFDKLKLNKEQKEQASQILSAAMEKAAPTRDLLNKGRIVIANAITGKAGEDEVKKMLGEYAAVSATMTGIEADVFAKLYALLKPNQQSKAPQAFELLAGMFAGGGMQGGGGRDRGGQGGGEGRQ